MKNIETSILINGSKEQVWETLMNFDQFTNWNPFITSLSGKAQVGETLAVTIHPPGQQPQQFTPMVQVVDINKEFKWLGKLFIRGLFDGEHYFIIEEISDQKVKFIHGENFSGLLVGPLLSLFGKATKNGFENMNSALQAKVEAL